jgi:hypothetical protein
LSQGIVAFSQITYKLRGYPKDFARLYQDRVAFSQSTVKSSRCAQVVSR